MPDQSLTMIAPRGVARSFDPADMFEAWQADLRERVLAGELAQATATTYARGMRAFLDWTEAQGVDRIGPQAVRRWKAAMLGDGLTPAGVNVRFAGVRAFFAWATATQGLAYDPTAGVKGARRHKRQTHKRDPLTDAEVLRVLGQPDQSTDLGKRDRAMLHLLAYCGLRTVELQRAKVGDLRSGERLTLAIWGKGRDEPDESAYLVHPDAIAALYDWLAVHPWGGDPGAPLFCGLGNRNRGGALSSQSLRATIKGHYKAAGIRDARKTAHSMRHTFVTNLIRHGVAPSKIQTATRHKSIDTLMIYAHEVDRERDPAEAYVDYGE